MPQPRSGTYGEWRVSSQPRKVFHADRILGAKLSRDSSGRPEWVEFQWQDAPGADFHQMQLDFPNAIALLSMLKCLQLDSGVDFPDDPRAPSAR